MVEFPKFDPYSVLGGGGRSSKVAKVAKAKRTLGALAALAAPPDRARSGAAGTPAKWSDIEEERSAIVEFDGKVPRDWAEAFARLNCSQTPAGVSSDRWRRFVDDCGVFLDGGWAARAHDLGWSPLDLLGCDRRHSFIDIESSGLLWQIEGAKLILLTRYTAVVEDANAKSTRFVKLPVRAGLVLAWRPVQPIEGRGGRHNSRTTP